MLNHLNEHASESQAISVILLLFTASQSQPHFNELASEIKPINNTLSPVAKLLQLSSFILTTKCSPILALHASQQTYTRSAVFFVWRDCA